MGKFLGEFDEVWVDDDIIRVGDLVRRKNKSVEVECYNRLDGTWSNMILSRLSYRVNEVINFGVLSVVVLEDINNCYFMLIDFEKV